MRSLLTCHGLAKTYPLGKRKVEAVRGVDLRIDDREFVVIAGPSGSGKTTLLNLLGLIDRPDAGQLVLEGEDLARTPENHLTRIRRRRIGFVFQNFNLVPVLSAYENVEYPLLLLGHSARKRRVSVERYLTRVGLWDRRHHRPAQLSGGEQQRLAIARALVKQPRLVIADEPTANLDSENTHQITRTMQELNAEEATTFIVASHDPLVIDSFRRVVRMRDGRLESAESA